nr:unnamed protein product [Digitaria exilis]
MGYNNLAMKALVVSIVLGVVAAGVELPGNKKVARQVPAIYVFGDSTMDVGNNNYLPGNEVPRADHPYYGVDLPGSGKPTGRFSNGYNVADFVGSGILDSTNAGGNIPLWQQVRLFESTKAEMEATVGPQAVSHLVSKSFFLFGIGSNDFFAFTRELAKQNRSATQSDVAALYGSLVSNYSASITELYTLGARKFGIINVGPVGCVPRVRVLNATGGCVDALNQLAAGFDVALSSKLAELAAKLPGMAYSVADSFGYASGTDPKAAGFVSADSACCGGGRLGADADCQLGATLCADRDRFLFWDRVHPSQRSAMLSAQAFYDGPAHFTSPITFKQLAQHNI